MIIFPGESAQGSWLMHLMTVTFIKFIILGTIDKPKEIAWCREQKTRQI
jgi:hypothetical protein